MNKTEMVKILVEETDYTKKELNKLKKDAVQEIYDTFLSMNDGEGLKYNEDYTDDFEGERVLNENETEIANHLTEFHGLDGVEEVLKMKEEAENYLEEEEEVQINISDLSKYEQRHYAKTGQLPQSTINRYTRFDEEDVDEGE